MKEKEQAAVCVDEKGCTEQTRNTDKEIFDDSCFKTPLLLPPRKGGGRRRGGGTRNGQLNPHETSRRASSSPVRSPEKESFPNGSPPSSSRPNPKLVSCSCSSSFIANVFPKIDQVPPMKETIIDEFSLLLFKNKEDFQAFQAEVDAAKAKEEAEQRKRQYEENVRLGLVKKKGRKSKAQIEKEKKEERRRLRREKKEQRRKERREHREKEGASLEPKERKSRKERRERKREKKERKEKERKEREKLAAEKKESVSIEKKERKPRKPRDPNAPKRPRQPRQPKASTSNTPEVASSNISGGTGAASATVPWMNEATLTVCAASPLPAANHTLKRPLDTIRDPLSLSDKRVKLDTAYDDYKNGLIGIAVKSDSSAIVGASPPGAPRVSTATGGVNVNDANAVTPTPGGNPSAPWSAQLSRPRSSTNEQRTPTTTSSVVETTHPVDPGHNAPSTSVAPSVPSTSVSAAANNVALPIQGTASLFVNTSMGPPSIASAATVVGGMPTGSGGVLSARDFASSSVGGDPRTTPQSALLDPLRQAFLSNPSFAASLNAAAGFGNAFLAGTSPNAAAAAFPFLATQILQQQQAQQPISLPQSASLGAASSMAGSTQPSVSNTAGAAVAGVPFSPGAALGPQLAGAALLGRTLPPAAALSQPALPIKAKQGRWCAMHVKIAYEISARKERRGTPQPAINSAAGSSQSAAAAAASSLRNAAAPPLCPPSTSNAHLASLTGGFSNSYSAMAAAGALQPPFGSLPFQQLSDPNKLVRQTATPKPPQGRPASAMQRGGSTAAAQGGMHLPLGAAGAAAASLGAASMQLGAANALQGALPNVVGTSLPLTAALPASGSLTNGTSDAAAQAAMFAALAQSTQQGAGLSSAALSSNPFLLSAAAAQQQHSLSAVAAAAAAGTPSQSQSVFPTQRLFDPSMTAAVLQQMQSMEAMRQSAAAAQMNAAAAAAAANATQHAASASNATNATTLDLMRMQMEQQMMERYAVAMGVAAASSSGAPGAGATAVSSTNHSLDLMRQQIFAAQIRQQQQQQAAAVAVAAAAQQQQPSAAAAQQQPSLEALIEMQRQQQQQQQLLNASRAAATLPGGYALPAGAATAAGISSAPTGLPQGLSASGLFNASHLMSMGGAAAAAAANLQQSLYGKNPYSNTLEQLARQKRDGDMMQPGR